MTPTVLVHIDEDGEETYKISGDVTFVVVDERSPHDRAYQYRTQTPIADILAIIGDEVGSSSDPQHAALAHKIECAAKGLPALSLVPSREQGE
jgi:hypothetical protein